MTDDAFNAMPKCAFHINALMRGLLSIDAQKQCQHRAHEHGNGKRGHFPLLPLSQAHLHARCAGFERCASRHLIRIAHARKRRDLRKIYIARIHKVYKGFCFGILRCFQMRPPLYY